MNPRRVHLKAHAGRSTHEEMKHVSIALVTVLTGVLGGCHRHDTSNWTKHEFPDLGLRFEAPATAEVRRFRSNSVVIDFPSADSQLPLAYAPWVEIVISRTPAKDIPPDWSDQPAIVHTNHGGKQEYVSYRECANGDVLRLCCQMKVAPKSVAVDEPIMKEVFRRIEDTTPESRTTPRTVH